MKTLHGMGIAVMLVLGCSTAPALERPVKVAFETKVSEHKWTLKELDPNLPSDWSGYNTLVMEMRTSTPQNSKATGRKFANFVGAVNLPKSTKMKWLREIRQPCPGMRDAGKTKGAQ